MKRKRTRYLGMTGTQIGILAGLLVVAMLSIGGLLWIITSAAIPADIPPAQTAIPTATEPATASPSATPGPTATATIQAPIAPPDGWLMFESEGVKIWLPDSYVGGDMLKKRSKTISIIKSQIKSKRTIAEIYQATSEMMLAMIDKNSINSNVITNVLVLRYKSDENTSLNEFVQQGLDALSTSITLYGDKKMTIAGREARRLEMERRDGTKTFNQVAYFIKNQADIWVVQYNIDPTNMVDVTPTIRTSIQTLIID